MLALIAALFSALQLVSSYVFHFRSFLYAESDSWIFNALLLATFFILFFTAGRAVYWALDRGSEAGDTDKGRRGGLRQGLLYSGVLLLGWSPWLYAFYPGSLWSDMCYEYDQYYGSYPFDSAMQFPPFPAYVMGLLMDLGKNVFSSDNAGMFLYIILQTAVCAAACAKALLLLDELCIRREIVRLVLFVYAFFPDFGASVQLGANNVLNYGLTLLSCTYVYVICLKIYDGDEKRSMVFLCICFIVCASLSSLWRREMLYIYALIAALLVICCFRGRLRRCGAVLLAGLLILCLGSALSDRIVIEKLMGRTYSEAPDSKILSLPLRQTAHFVKYRGDLVSDMERQILDGCLDYGYYGIERNYESALADPLIFHFVMEDPSCRHGFWRVYWSFLRKDPAMFLESLIAASNGYFSILPNSHSAPGYENGAGMRLPILKMMKEPNLPFGRVSSIEYRAETKELRALLTAWLDELEGSFNVFFGFGICTFLIVVLCSYTVQKERKAAALVPYILPVMLCLVCIASPVNDCGRYYMGIFYLMPFLIGVAMRPVQTGAHREKLMPDTNMAG